MSINCGELYKNNTLLVEFGPLTTRSNRVETVLASGTVTVNVYAAGTATLVTNGGPFTGTITAGYAEVVLPSNLGVTVGLSYDITGTIDGAADAEWTITRAAKKRANC